MASIRWHAVGTMRHSLACAHAQMALKGSSSEALARTKTEYESFLGDAAKLKEVRERMKVRHPWSLAWGKPRLLCVSALPVQPQLGTQSCRSFPDPDCRGPACFSLRHALGLAVSLAVREHGQQDVAALFRGEGVSSWPAVFLT